MARMALHRRGCLDRVHISRFDAASCLEVVLQCVVHFCGCSYLSQ